MRQVSESLWRKLATTDRVISRRYDIKAVTPATTKTSLMGWLTRPADLRILAYSIFLAKARKDPRPKEELQFSLAPDCFLVCCQDNEE